MSHTMQPLFPTKFAGTALTVLLKKEENTDPNALSGMLGGHRQWRTGFGLRHEN